MKSGSAAVVLLLLVLAILWSFNTHRVGLWEPTEARYAEIAWRMVETGDWWTPHFNFLPHFHKPAPAYWPPAVALLLLGKHPWAPRISSLVLALLCVTLTYIWGRRMWDGEHGLLASMILGTTLLVTAQARVVSSDLPLSVAILLALVAAWEVLLGKGKGTGWVWIYWLSLGAAFAVKGPVALLPALVPVLLFAFLARNAGDRRELRPARALLGRFHWKLGLLLFAVVALPWYLALSAKHPGLLGYFLGNHILGRVATSVHKRPGPVYYFIAILAGGFFPWTALLAWALVRHLRHPRSGWSLWSLCIWGPAFVVFSLSGSKLPAYILPLFPIWSLMSARSLMTHRRKPGALPMIPPTMTALLFFLGGGTLLVLLVLPLASEWGLSLVRGRVVLGAAALLLGGVTVAMLSRRGSRAWVWATVATWAIFFVFAASSLPTLAPRAGAVLDVGREAGRALTDRPDTKLVAYRCQLGSLAFYTDRPIPTVGEERETQFADPDLGARLVLPRGARLDSLMEQGAAFWVAKSSRKEELEERLGVPVTTIVREGPWELYQVDERPAGF